MSVSLNMLKRCKFENAELSIHFESFNDECAIVKDVWTLCLSASYVMHEKNMCDPYICFVCFVSLIHSVFFSFSLLVINVFHSGPHGPPSRSNCTPFQKGSVLEFLTSNFLPHSYIWLGSFFWFKIVNLNIFGGFQKNKYFWGYEDFMDIVWIFLGSSQKWTSFRRHFYAF